MVSPNTEVRRSLAQPKLRYQPALDGLRAISVIAVILYHAGITWMPGGFLGVEVFFVVSGFLITALLLEERQRSGTIDLRHFWIRRARRLLPALYLLLVTVIIAALLFYRDAAGRLGGDVIAALFYVSNWWNIFLKESYFAQAGRPPLLRHLWSLAVEEQFYLLFPPILMFCLRRFRMRSVRFGLVAISIASALWMAVLFDPYSDPSRVYYGTDTRLAGMLMGALLATVWAPWRARSKAHPVAAVSLDVLGVTSLIVLGLFLVNVNEFDSFIYRGGFLLLDVVCVALIAVLVHPAARMSRLLAFKALVWVGVRSYAIYLWHWPIFQVTRPELDIPLKGLPLLVLRLALTLGAAELSFRLIETPFRKGLLGNWWRRVSVEDPHTRVVARRQALTVGMASLVAVLLMGAGLANASTNSKRAELEAAQHLAPPLEEPSGRSDAGSPASSTPETTVPGATTTTIAGSATTTVAAGATTVVTTTPVAGSDVVAVGDSVMLGAAGAIRSAMPGIRVDAKVGRQFNQVLSVVDWYAKNGYLIGPLVVHMGTNGVFDDADMDRLIAAAGHRKVLLINAKVARPWEALVNARIAAAVERHKNARLLDWFALSSAHPEWFANDGAHLRPEGAAAFANLIKSNL